MRGKKAVINTICSLLEEFITIACGLVLPRLILSAYGSDYNGLVNSITQFLGCAVLLRSGIGGATRAALYKPLAEKDQKSFSAIVKATDIFMKKISLILAGSIVAFAVIYAFFICKEFNWLFTFSLFLIIGASTFMESFLGITYLIVLQADQRVWVVSLLKGFCCIANTVLCAVLIMKGAPIHIVKLSATIIYVIYPILQSLYVKKKYQINRNVKPDMRALSQRWEVFWVQVSTFVMNGTDTIVLTIFTSMSMVSVYSIYNMILNALKKGLSSFLNSLEAAFGNMIAKEEMDNLSENIAIMEMLINSISTVVYTCATVLILDFVSLYTKGITDVEYIRPLFAYLMILVNYIYGIRMVYQSVVQAAGHYKQTKKGAIFEVLINVSVSCLLVQKFNLVGVAVGTLIATTFRTYQYAIYVSTNILRRSRLIAPCKCAVSFLEGCVGILIINSLHFNVPTSYFNWIIKACVTAIVISIVVFVGNWIFFKRDFQKLRLKAWRILSHT